MRRTNEADNPLAIRPPENKMINRQEIDSKMAPLDRAERKRFEIWYNDHWGVELVTGHDDVEAAWGVWKAAIAEGSYTIN